MLISEDVNLFIGWRVLSITLSDLASSRNRETSMLKFHLLLIKISFNNLRIAVMERSSVLCKYEQNILSDILNIMLDTSVLSKYLLVQTNSFSFQACIVRPETIPMSYPSH